jgi:putative spermidine/putrescine transport system ATP-binding protein
MIPTPQTVAPPAPEPSTAEPLVQFVGVQKSYDGETLVVKNLDLDIARGEFLTLLGPSGSGKTTTLMMLAGFEAPTSGKIVLGGRDITRLPPHRREIGVVFQNYALFPHMNVVENVGYPLRVRGVAAGEIATRVARALDMVKLRGFGERRPAQLSGGQQQRVALARALVFRPELVLLDEPLGALDKQLREQMQYELTQLHEDLGVTMVYVTHDQAEALIMSDRIAVFSDGMIQQLAGPTELYERPRNAFVAGFVGESNRLSGTVVAASGARLGVRLDDGPLLHAVAMDAEIRPDSRVLLSLRPERVRLAPDPGADNRLSARVEKIIYLGDTTRAVLAIASGDELVARVPNASGALSIGRGETVEIGWRAEDCLAFSIFTE